MAEELKNPFIGYSKKILLDKKSINPVHEIVNMYYKLKGIDKMEKTFYEGKYSYPKLAKEAKHLIEACSYNLDDALWALDKMKYKADKGKFDWSISTCLKHKLTW